MSFEEEWAGLVREAQGNASGSTGTRLNKAPSGGSGDGSGADLIVRNDELGKIGNLAYSLYGKIASETKKPHTATTTAAKSLSGQDLDMGDALLEMADAWVTQTGVVKEACAHLSNHLDFTAKAHHRDEQKISTEMRDVQNRAMTPSRIEDYLG